MVITLREFRMVKDVVHIETVQEAMHLLGISDIRNPLVEVVDFSKSPGLAGMDGVWVSYGFYAVNLKTKLCAHVQYGRSQYDYDQGTLLFIAPNQPMQINLTAEPEGVSLLFQPELIRGTQVERQMPSYRFFDYNADEALHISEREKLFFYERINDITTELEGNFDRHSHQLIVSQIELLLNYCIRFYDRQFLMREPASSELSSRFDRLLSDYIANGGLKRHGIPSVKFFADRLCMSTNYFGDAVKSVTGQSPQSIIQERMIAEAKHLLTSTNLMVKEVAYSLGYEYPQYFVRLFRQKTGQTPTQFRQEN